MHWFHLPKIIHDEDVIREYEYGESQKLGRWIKWLLIALPIILLIIWFVFR